jgi:hypothetical protein
VKAFSKPWRTDTYEEHLKLQHPTKWCVSMGWRFTLSRRAFFDVAVDEVAHINSLDAHVDAGSLSFWIRDNIVLGVIRELFFDPEKGERVESALKIFTDDVESRNARDKECDGPVCVERKIVVKGYGIQAHY